MRWKLPYSTKEKDSLADYAVELIDGYYVSMKAKLGDKGHEKWEMVPLPWQNLEYAVKDAYVTNEVYKRIVRFEMGQENLLVFQMNKEKIRARKNKKKRNKKLKSSTNTSDTVN